MASNIIVIVGIVALACVLVGVFPFPERQKQHGFSFLLIFVRRIIF